MLLEPVDTVVLAIADQTEGQLVALEQNGVRILLLLCDGIAKGTKGLLGDDTAVGEPLAVGLNASIGDIAALVTGGLDNLAFCIALRFALLENVELLDLLCCAVKVFTRSWSSGGAQGKDKT